MFIIQLYFDLFVFFIYICPAVCLEIVQPFNINEKVVYLGQWQESTSVYTPYELIHSPVFFQLFKTFRHVNKFLLSHLAPHWEWNKKKKVIKFVCRDFILIRWIFNHVWWLLPFLLWKRIVVIAIHMHKYEF